MHLMAERSGRSSISASLCVALTITGFFAGELVSPRSAKSASSLMELPHGRYTCYALLITVDTIRHNYNGSLRRPGLKYTYGDLDESVLRLTTLPRLGSRG